MCGAKYTKIKNANEEVLGKWLLGEEGHIL